MFTRFRDTDFVRRSHCVNGEFSVAYTFARRESMSLSSIQLSRPYYAKVTPIPLNLKNLLNFISYRNYLYIFYSFFFVFYLLCFIIALLFIKIIVLCYSKS
jgi:hypothetical protein